MSETDYCDRCGLEMDASECGDCPRCRVLATLTDEQTEAVLGAWDDAWTPPAPAEVASVAAGPVPLVEGKAGAFFVGEDGRLTFARAPKPAPQAQG